MEKKHQDKVVVITGSSRGIGLGIARHLAEEGARIAVMGRNYDTAKAAADVGRRWALCRAGAAIGQRL